MCLDKSKNLLGLSQANCNFRKSSLNQTGMNVKPSQTIFQKSIQIFGISNCFWKIKTLINTRIWPFLVIVS